MGKWKTYSDGDTIPTDDATSYEDLNHWLDYRDYSDDTHASGWGASEKGRWWWNTTLCCYQYWDGSAVQTVPGVAGSANVDEVWVEADDVDDLLDKISSYQGTKNIVIPACTSNLQIDESVVIDTEGFSLENRPPKSATIELTVNGEFSIENGAVDWNEKSWYFTNLLFDLNDVATRCITTENGTSAKRTYQPRIEYCRFVNLGAASCIPINLKDVEAATVKDNVIYALNSTGIGIRFYNTGTRQIGNSILEHNEIFVASGATGGIGVQVDASGGATGGQIGNLHLNHNHFVGAQTYDSLAIDLESHASVDLTGIFSDTDRFENTRILSTDATGALGQIEKVYINDMHHTSPNYATAGLDQVFLSTACARCFIRGGYSASGGSDHNDARFCHNDGAGTNSQYNAIEHVWFGWVKTVDANKSYLNNDGAIVVTDCYGSDGAITDLP